MDFIRLCESADVQSKIGFIGGGNMAQAMIRGFLNSGTYMANLQWQSRLKNRSNILGLVPGESIGVSDPFPKALEAAKVGFSQIVH